MNWGDFQKKIKEKYLIQRFYDNKAKEFHDVRLGQVEVEEFLAKCTSLLGYVPYIREEKAKV